jgi:hypothetical protein
MYTHIYVCVKNCVCVCVCVCVCACVCLHVYVCMCIYIHAYIHKYIHIIIVQVVEWLESVNQGHFSKRFEKAAMDGKALMELARLSEAQPETAYKVRNHVCVCVCVYVY